MFRSTGTNFQLLTISTRESKHVLSRIRLPFVHTTTNPYPSSIRLHKLQTLLISANLSTWHPQQRLQKVQILLINVNLPTCHPQRERWVLVSSQLPLGLLACHVCTTQLHTDCKILLSSNTYRGHYSANQPLIKHESYNLLLRNVKTASR